VHLFDGYWEDIGTIRSFFEANLALAASERPFDLESANAPLYTRPRFLPPSRFDGATVRHSLIADGCVLEDGAVVENSVVGVRCHIGRGVVIRNSVLLGVDEYETAAESAAAAALGQPPMAIGDGTFIEGAIIDKNCRIGRHVRIANDAGVETSEETPEAMVRDGIACVQKGAILPDGWHL
jgi:glucose-1-phosphate adenylyltransferase